MSRRIAVVVFPGTNCEYDVVDAVRELGSEAEIVWHHQTKLSGFDAVVIPGGFAHGDYLRPGAIARFSPVMEAVRCLALEGGPVVGICNGFQVLTEAGLLPGALQKNSGLRFICDMTTVRVESTRSVITAQATSGTLLRLPINHFEGRYSVDKYQLASMRERGQIVLRYVDNPNGSMDDIAAVANEDGNVVGLMPHPERATAVLLGSEDGKPLLNSLLGSVVGASS